MLNQLITSKTRLRPVDQILHQSGQPGVLNGLASEFNESTNSDRKELNHLSEAGYLENTKTTIRLPIKQIPSTPCLKYYKK